VSVRKRGYEVERIVLNAFLRHHICRKPLSEIGASDFASYRDERLMAIRASTLRRELAPLNNMFEIAKDEWGLPLRENPLRKVRVTAGQQRRERRLKHGELDELIVAARVCRNPLILPIILLAVETGMRRSDPFDGNTSTNRHARCSSHTQRTVTPESFHLRMRLPKFSPRFLRVGIEFSRLARMHFGWHGNV
jgi:hypothetical protein